MTGLVAWMVVGCALMAAGCGQGVRVESAGAASEVEAMTNMTEQASRLLELPDDDYFAFDEDRQDELQAALSNLVSGAAPPDPDTARPPLLMLGAPKAVNIDERTSVPVLVGQVHSGLRAWEVNHKTNLHVFVRSLATGRLLTVQPLVSMRRGRPQPRSGAGEKPDEINARTMRYSINSVDLQGKLEGAMTSGSYVVSAVAYDLSSNSVPILLERSEDEPAPPVAAVLTQPYVSSALDDSAQLATRMTAPERIPANREGEIAVTIQVTEGAGVRRAEGGEAYWDSNLILVKLDEVPVIVPVTVPVQEVAAAAGTPAFNASYRIGLNAALQGVDSGTYQVYLDAGLKLLGPYPLEIAD